jgi:hypothetical protein
MGLSRPVMGLPYQAVSLIILLCLIAAAQIHSADNVFILGVFLQFLCKGYFDQYS